jgi:hypothetical protein
LRVETKNWEAFMGRPKCEGRVKTRPKSRQNRGKSSG